MWHRAQACVIHPAASAEELPASPCLPAPGTGRRHWPSPSPTICSVRSALARSRREPYESGLPSEVTKSFRFGISFYLIAMLFILFDIEVVFLYPVGAAARCLRDVRPRRDGRVRRVLLAIALVVRVEKGSARMEVTRSGPRTCARAGSRAQQMLRGDIEGDDLEQLRGGARAPHAHGERPELGPRRTPLFPLGFGLACCAIEMITVIGSPRNDLSRFGAEVIRFTPRQADLLILSGRVSIKMAPIIRRLYDQMLEPKWVIAMGACSSTAGMFNNYARRGRRGQVPARGRVRARLPAPPRGADLRDQQPPGQDQGRARTGLARALPARRGRRNVA